MGEALFPPLPEDLSEVLRHLRACAPNEGCGVLLRAQGEGPWRWRPLRNALAARDAYAFELREWLGVLQEAEARGEQVVWVIHSHVETGAEFSHEDRAQAAPGGQPLLPGVSYLVVSIQSGRIAEVGRFTWTGKDFAGDRVEVSPLHPQPLKIP